MTKIQRAKASSATRSKVATDNKRQRIIRRVAAAVVALQNLARDGLKVARIVFDTPAESFLVLPRCLVVSGTHGELHAEGVAPKARLSTHRGPDITAHETPPQIAGAEQ